jgi:hypothetical protein
MTQQSNDPDVIYQLPEAQGGAAENRDFIGTGERSRPAKSVIRKQRAQPSSARTYSVDARLVAVCLVAMGVAIVAAAIFVRLLR